TVIATLSLHDALPISPGGILLDGAEREQGARPWERAGPAAPGPAAPLTALPSRETLHPSPHGSPPPRGRRPARWPHRTRPPQERSEEHTSELQSRVDL